MFAIKIGCHPKLAHGKPIAPTQTPFRLDHLLKVVALIILGDGRPSFSLGPIDRADQALRWPIRAHSLDGEILFDCEFTAQRAPIGRPKKSM
jgi:hypothetical protein